MLGFFGRDRMWATVIAPWPEGSGRAENENRYNATRKQTRQSQRTGGRSTANTDTRETSFLQTRTKRLHPSPIWNDSRFGWSVHVHGRRVAVNTGPCRGSLSGRGWIFSCWWLPGTSVKQRCWTSPNQLPHTNQSPGVAQTCRIIVHERFACYIMAAKRDDVSKRHKWFVGRVVHCSGSVEG